MAVIDEVQADDQRIPLTTHAGTVPGPAVFSCAADTAARECFDLCRRVLTADAIDIGIAMICRRRGIAPPGPDGEAPEKRIERIKRAVDKAWWRRNLRKEWMRRFEHVAIQLGLTHVRQDPYVTRETALLQDRQNKVNAAMLEAQTATNEHGQAYTLAELNDCGMGNKANRRGELMLRIRGFEEIAQELGDVGMFWTITCPSKFHAVGGTNPRYNGATPREAQAYLCKVWQCIRAAFKRAGIQPYGFRIAEPHSDGCPHWHMLLFVNQLDAPLMEKIVTGYALAMDHDEPGAQENRVKLVNIEAGKGTAAGYIAKYVSKNIDGAGVGDFKAFEDGRTYSLVTDDYGNVEITPSQRVTYWSQVWGIRQFQQIGGAPVGVWREIRRLRAEAIANAPQQIKDAFMAAQKIESDDPAVAKQASFADYLRAQGGPTVGRDAAIKIAARVVTIEGRYATYKDDKPVGVYLASQPHAVYEAVHYRWTIARSGEGAGVAFDLPWTGVNNCTVATDGGPEFDGSRQRLRGLGFQPERPFQPLVDEDPVEVFRQHAKGQAEWRRFGHLRYLQQKYRT